MGIEDPGLGKIILVLGFISILLVGLFFAKRNGSNFITKLNNNKFLKLEETIAISSQDRISIVTADNSRYLIIHGKGHQPNLTLINNTPLKQEEITALDQDNLVKESL